MADTRVSELERLLAEKVNMVHGDFHFYLLAGEHDQGAEDHDRCSEESATDDGTAPVRTGQSWRMLGKMNMM